MKNVVYSDRIRLGIIIKVDNNLIVGTKIETKTEANTKKPVAI